LFNPTSIKDRAVMNMVKSAMADGKISSGTAVIEASIGNTAIPIASIGFMLGYKTEIFMSELCRAERIRILCAYVAKLVLMLAESHTKVARERAMRYCVSNPNTTYFLDQHDNIHNGQAHI